MAFPGCASSPPLRVVLARAPSDRAVPKLRPSMLRMSTIGRASLATRLVAERLPGPHVRPSVDITCRCPLPRRDRSRITRRDGANRRARSVLVGSHHLDGLRHLQARELVASRSRPWGPQGFCTSTPHACRASSTSPPVHMPSRAFPSKQPFTRHRVPMPPRRSPPSWDGGATSRPCSAGKSERHTRRCRRACLPRLSWVSLAPVLTITEAMMPSDVT